MIGLGGGSISTYLGRAMPDVIIDTVEIDPGVIAAAKKYFGIRDSKRVRYLAATAGCSSSATQPKYDVILIDAFHGGYVPFHLLTKEFYALVKERLAPGGVGRVQRARRHEALCLDGEDARRGVPGRDLYPSGEGEVAAVVTGEPVAADDVLAKRAAALQQQYASATRCPACWSGGCRSRRWKRPSC